jgi:putative phage-type endonuclease
MIAEYHDIDQSTQDWHDIRRGVITTSHFAAIMANYPKPFGNPAHEYAMKVALESVTGVTIDTFQSADMAHGIEFEPIAREAYETDRFQSVSNGGFWLSSCGRIGSSPDGLVGDDGLIEIKCPKWNTHFSLIASGGYNTAYRWQIQGQLFLTGRKWCDFVSFCPDFPDHKMLYICRVEASIEDQIAMNRRLSDFIDLVDEYKSKISQ